MAGKLLPESWLARWHDGREKFVARCTSWFASPAIAVVVAVLSTVASALIGKEVFQTSCEYAGFTEAAAMITQNGPALQLYAFWITAAMSAVILYGYQKAVAVREDKTEAALKGSLSGLQESSVKIGENTGHLTASVSELREAARQLPEFLRTQPPQEFLQSFSAMFENAFVSCKKSTNSVEDIDIQIRSILTAIATLARLHDGITGSGLSAGRYNANLMVLRTGAAMDEWKEHLQFTESDSLAGLFGVLALPTAYIAEVDLDGDLIEDKSRPLALAIPPVNRRKTDAGKSLVLPGAPMAFCEASTIEHFASNGAIRQWCEDKGSFAPHIVEKIDAFFNDPKNGIGGFFSMVVSAPSDEKGRLGVLNVHWSESVRLRVPQSAVSFAQAIAPLVVLLGDQLHKKNGLNGSHPPSRPPSDPSPGPGTSDSPRS